MQVWNKFFKVKLTHSLPSISLKQWSIWKQNKLTAYGDSAHNKAFINLLYMTTQNSDQSLCHAVKPSIKSFTMGTDFEIHTDCR